MTLDKDWRLPAGEWDAEELSERQIEYAANDVMLSWLSIYPSHGPQTTGIIHNCTPRTKIHISLIVSKFIVLNNKH